MPETMKGPGIFLAQFAGDAAPFNCLKSIAEWAAGLGYKGVQIPTWDGRLFDLAKAAGSKTYCDEVKGVCAAAGVEITELSSHLQGQLVAVHPAYDAQFDGFAPASVHGNPTARQQWAVEQMHFAAQASRHLGLQTSVSFSGALAFPYLYPWPQRPAGLIEEAFAELGRRWKPILDAYDDAGVDLCYEIHPGEDVFDGATFEMFLEAVAGHTRCNINYDPSHFLLQQLDYLAFIDIYHERIKAFHVKDAEFNPTAAKEYIPGIRDGSTGPAGSARSATARSTFPASFRSWPSTAMIPGQCWNGNAVSSTRRTALRKARLSSSITSSASPKRLLTISRAARRTRSC
jgi:sugar phosphate isomerase/epimerase